MLRISRRVVRVVATIVAAALVTPSSRARADQPQRIEDNSFLIEEAYNQDQGIIQHIQTYQKQGGQWWYTFTEEWPLHGKRHQISAMVPFSGADRGPSGIGDVAVNYRWQARDREGIAIAPRLTVLLPTGDYRKSLGAGSTGLQFNLPLSADLGTGFVTHWNAGGTWTPRTRATDGSRAQTGNVTAGASLIWLAAPNFNVMFESLAVVSKTLFAGGSITHSRDYYLDPGVRFAINFRSGLQIVPGLAVPMRITPGNSATGAFAYLSFEHRAF